MSYLGFDTSNYTTSLALVDDDGRVLENRQLLLSVKENERGLRQSDALFLHIKNLPALLEGLNLQGIKAVGASVRPRDVEGSYMPVFLASRNYGLLAAKTLGVPFYETSHQNGHLFAALAGANLKKEDRFFAVQLSGGTFEVLLAERSAASYRCTILFSSIDITAGQLLDRIGVAMGQHFPAGRAMDEMAAKTTSTHAFRPSLSEKGASFAGLETKVRSRYLPLLDETSGNVLCRSLFETISLSVAALLKRSLQTYPDVADVVFMGGVCESRTLRSFFAEHIPAALQVHYAPLKLSTDNAVGIALYAKQCHREAAPHA